MKTLTLVENHPVFKEVYEGTVNRINSKTFESEEVKITCILDDNCVRWTTTVNGKLTGRREFSNWDKAKCFMNAEKALNRAGVAK